jgi:hypothetical protein
MNKSNKNNKIEIIESEASNPLDAMKPITKAIRYAHLCTPEKTKQYNQAFYIKNKHDTARICEICTRPYSMFNKSRHNKSKQHLKCMPKLIDTNIDKVYDIIDKLE